MKSCARAPRFLIAVMLLVSGMASHAQSPGVTTAPSGNGADDSTEALRISQAAIGNTLGDHTLRDRQGRAVELSSFRGKPLVISLVYTSCYYICSMNTRHLGVAVEKARAALGEDSFNVLTIGFDTAVDTPQAMAAFARKQGVDMSNWNFLSADAATMARLVEELGFTYRRSPKGFDHLIQATIVDATGKVHVQVYGELIHTPLLVEPLKQLVFGAPADEGLFSSLLNNVRLFCTTYDPSSDSYYFDYSLFIGMFIGAMIIGGVIAFLVREMRRGRTSTRG